VVVEQAPRIARGQFIDLAEVGIAVGSGVPVDVIADPLFFGASTNSTVKGKWQRSLAVLILVAGRLHFKPFERLGVFAPLVGALVFKTSGGFEQSSLWVRFPYTPV
jgi:hypothetical protein